MMRRLQKYTSRQSASAYEINLKTQATSGFTIVELLIVIVVIGILAAISIVAYNGIQGRAQAAAASSALEQTGKKLALYAVDNSAYPIDLATIGITNSGGTSYQYSVNNGTAPQSYCVTATNGTTSYKTDQGGILSSGGRNLFQKSATFSNYTTGTDNANPAATYTTDAVNGDYQTFVNTNGGNRYWYPLMQDSRVQNGTYTISLDINTTVGTWGGYWYPSENYASLTFPNTGGLWQRWSWTYTQTGATNTGNKLFGFKNSTAGNSISFRKLKLETANAPTCWVSEP